MLIDYTKREILLPDFHPNVCIFDIFLEILAKFKFELKDVEGNYFNQLIYQKFPIIEI